MLVIDRPDRPDGFHFQVRAAALLRHDDHLLLHRLAGDAFWSLPGGRVEPGEDSAATVVRELREELGVTVRVTGAAWICESFFRHQGRSRQELGFIHHAVLEDATVALADTGRVHAGLEDHLALEFRWFRAAELPALAVYPVFLRSAALDPRQGHWPRHVVEREAG
ncbi:MAG: hypothetical protein RIQ53_1461 [Pseudomonadota bacterium]|jgi:8-oxo-dGTP pyrophosphatase MutT (NUDIX family)